MARDARLQHGHDLGREVGEAAGAVGDRRGAQPVQLVQDPVDGRVGDEVVDVVRVGGRALRLVDEGRGAREGVVGCADQVAVREAFAAELGGLLAWSSAWWWWRMVVSRLTSLGSNAVNSLNSFKLSPMSILSSWFSNTLSSACVPHAFWIVCAAKEYPL